MKEKLQQYALLAEIISALCIVLSLVFVGLQLRQGNLETAANAEAVRSQVRESLLNADLNILEASMYDPSLSFQRKPDPSDYHYQFRLTNYFFLVFRTREIYWKHHERGLLDDETYRSYRQVFALGKDNPFFISVWNFTAESGMLSRGFTEETNTFMLEELGMNLNHPDALLYDIQMMLNQP